MKSNTYLLFSDVMQAEYIEYEIKMHIFLDIKTKAV